MDRSCRQEINKETLALNGTLDWMDIIDMYGTLHPKQKNVLYIFFKGTWNFLQDRSHSRPQNKPW